MRNIHGEWHGHVERVEVVSDDLVITVARVWAADDEFSCRAVSFFRFRDAKIVQIDEYWGDDGPPAAVETRYGNRKEDK